MASNREKFVELAEKRTIKAIKSIRIIGNLSNKTNYSYSDADVRKIISALENEMKNLKKKFESTSSESDIDFKL